jgi:LL-diaminopimelate aminotransferase
MGPFGQINFDSGEAFSQWMITEHLISTVPWDDCGAFVRFSVTFVSDTGHAGEAAIVAEVERRLSGWKFEF